MEIYWLWLSLIKGIGPVTLRKLVDNFGGPKSVYEASRGELLKLKGLRSSSIESILSHRSLEPAKGIYEAMLKDGIKLLTYDSPYFPSNINKHPNLPAVLYYRGILHMPTLSIGIVGSRRCTSYGKEVTRELAAFLGKSKVTVISGMAKGIDSYAHTACLKAGGYTIAFVANGLDICYPPEHQVLMDEIIENGAVISMYPPGTRPRQEYFPYRNKLLAAWVDKLVVVEAAERSGALITAEYAKEYKRKVYAVPNSIYSPESTGVNRLLLQGAEVYLEPGQVLKEVGFLTGDKSYKESNSPPKKNKEKLTSMDPIEKGIIERLGEPQDINRLLDLFDGDLSALLERLCQMEIEGKVIISGQIVLAGQ